jgi:hypothetical protein
LRPRTLLVLFALVAGLGGFIWFFERELPSTDERVDQVAGEQRTRLERVTPSVEGRAGGDAGNDNGASDEWVLTEPRVGRVDTEEVRDFLSRVQDVEGERTLADVSRSDLGLETPRAEVKFETGEEDVVVRFGSRIPASSNTIAEVGTGPPFHVVADSLFEDIARDPNEWRSRDAIPIERSQIERIEIVNPPTGVILERSEDGFQLAAPIEDVADEVRVSDFLTALVELEIEEFVDDPGEDLEPAPSVVRLTTTDADEPVLVEITPPRAGDELATVRVDGEVFRVESELVSLVERSPAEWRSTSWFDGEVFEIERFRIIRSGEEHGFQKREGKWLRGDLEIEYSDANSFLYALAGASGAPVDSRSRTGATREVEIALEWSAGTETLRLWKDSEGYLGGRDGRATLLRLASESAGEVMEKIGLLEPVSVSDESDNPG